MPKTIKLSAIRDLLEQIVDPNVSEPRIEFEPDAYDSTAVLILPGGEVIAYASYEVSDAMEERDMANVLAGVVSEAWRRDYLEVGAEPAAMSPKPGASDGKRGSGDMDGEEEDADGYGSFSFESELGRIYVCGIGSASIVSSTSGHTTSIIPKGSKPAVTENEKPWRYLLFGVVAPEAVPLSLLRAKGKAVKDHLQNAMNEIGPKAAALKVRPGRNSVGSGMGVRRALATRTASSEIVA